MSHIASVLLLTSPGDEGVGEAQRWLSENGWPLLVDIGAHAGGNKAIGGQIWAAGINYFDIPGFSEAIRDIDWEIPDSVQLIVNDENDDQFILRAGVSLGELACQP